MLPWGWDNRFLLYRLLGKMPLVVGRLRVLILPPGYFDTLLRYDYLRSEKDSFALSIFCIAFREMPDICEAPHF